MKWFIYLFVFVNSNILHAYIDDGAKGKNREDFYYKKAK